MTGISVEFRHISLLWVTPIFHSVVKSTHSDSICASLVLVIKYNVAEVLSDGNARLYIIPTNTHIQVIAILTWEYSEHIDYERLCFITMIYRVIHDPLYIASGQMENREVISNQLYTYVLNSFVSEIQDVKCILPEILF